MDKDSLKKKTVAQLREEAKNIPGVKGLSAMKKDDLVELILAQSPQAPAEKKPEKSKKKPAAAPKVLSKTDLKKRIRELKEEKRQALVKQDKNRIKECNREIHLCKHKLRQMAPKKQRKPKE